MENINMFLIDFMIAIYWIPCIYISSKSVFGSLLAFKRIDVKHKYYINDMVFGTLYVILGHLAIVAAQSFNNALLGNVIKENPLNILSAFNYLMLVLCSILKLSIPCFQWKNDSIGELFLEDFFSICLPLVIIKTFSNFSLKIMKILCDIQTSMYREFLADKYGLGPLCFCVLAMISLVFMFRFFLNISTLLQNTDDENELVISKGDFKSRMIVEPESLYEKEQPMKDENVNDE